MTLENLQKKLGYKFRTPALLKQALTHSSVSSKTSENYERLEFLGDRVLGVAVADLLYEVFPNEPEGSLSQRHTALVCKETVALVAKSLNLDKALFAANEEIRDNENVLCDVCEAVIGAIFKDSNCREAQDFVTKNWKDLVDRNLTPPKDAKTSLQEVAHVKGLGAPVYSVVSRSGSEHEPIFEIAVSVEGLADETGSGRNKKLAEQEAAGKMLVKLGYK